jgi:hypothetical protein
LTIYPDDKSCATLQSVLLSPRSPCALNPRDRPIDAMFDDALFDTLCRLDGRPSLGLSV